MLMSMLMMLMMTFSFHLFFSLMGSLRKLSDDDDCHPQGEKKLRLVPRLFGKEKTNQKTLFWGFKEKKIKTKKELNLLKKLAVLSPQKREKKKNFVEGGQDDLERLMSCVLQGG